MRVMNTIATAQVNIRNKQIAFIQELTPIWFTEIKLNCIQHVHIKFNHLYIIVKHSIILQTVAPFTKTVWL